MSRAKTGDRRAEDVLGLVRRQPAHARSSAAVAPADWQVRKSDPAWRVGFCWVGNGEP